MQAEELLKQGDLAGALTALQDRVRKDPSDAKLRIFLFQLLSVMGDWQRAIQQLKSSGTLDAAANTMAQMYREAIICEVYRDKVFAGEKAPLIFGEPEDWLAWMIEAVKLQAGGNLSAAEELRGKAFDAAPASAGSVNGTAFEWIADADPRLGPVLELVVNGRYFWAPFTAVHRLEFEAPSDLRDRVWTPATVTWANGGDAVALIPTRYAGTTTKGNDAQKLAHATDWLAEGESVTEGLGQRLLATDHDDYALMDIRELVIGDPPVIEAPKLTGEDPSDG
ncbi:MAG: type VI secretion system accessory protein TagJ [Pseudomonadota bacterium]